MVDGIRDEIIAQYKADDRPALAAARTLRRCCKWSFTRDNHKQLPARFKERARSHLLLAVWLLQIAMIVNIMYSLPLRGRGPMMSLLL
jgi:hypothetical protein